MLMKNPNSKLNPYNSLFTIDDSPFTILFILALSLALNLHALAADSFWGDEILTATFASRSPAEVIRWTASDIHPPLYYLLAGTFTRLTVSLGSTEQPSPISDWFWRFPSVIANVLTVAVTYQLALYVSRHLPHGFTLHVSRNTPPARKRHATRNTQHAPPLIAASAALLLSLAPIAIKYGQEARMHALFMCLAALATWLFFCALTKPRQWSRWLAFALATTANIYTMYFGFLILATQASFLLFTILHSQFFIHYSRFTFHATGRQGYAARGTSASDTQHGTRLTGFSTATVLSCLLYAPWWPVLFNILRKRAAVGAIEGGVGAPLTFMSGVVRALGPLPEPVAWGFLLLFITGLIFLARRSWPVATFAGLWLALPVALPIFLGDPRALQFRYAFVLPVYLTIIAYAVVSLSPLARFNVSTFQYANLLTYLFWLLATVSFIATLGIYNQTKPDWRSAAAYLDEHTRPTDVILIGPLWDEGRFIGYYYRGQAQLLTPAALVTNIERRAESMRANGGGVWAVNRFAPIESPVSKNIVFPGGVVLSEPTIAVYEPALLTEAAINLAAQAVEAAYPWTTEAEAEGVLNPDPRTAQAAALRALGDTLVAAGRPEEALPAYQRAVDIFPGWVSGFIVLAETQEAVGNLSAAVEAYRQAVAFNLKWQGPQADEAATLVETGQWAAALEKYHQIIGAE